MQKFWDLMAQSTIVQAVVTVMLVATCCYMWITAMAIPGELLGFTGAVLGFWFGTKAQQMAIRQSSVSSRKS